MSLNNVQDPFNAHPLNVDKASIRRKRQATLLDLQYAIERPIEDCPISAANTIAHYLEGLHKVALWPVSTLVQTSTI